jgi:hypothetical protein
MVGEPSLLQVPLVMNMFCLEQKIIKRHYSFEIAKNHGSCYYRITLL